MTLSTGTKLSHYEITSQIGKGGMGEVYQATDTKLGRSVAIKVLPEEFAQDTDRVARFQREAKLLASLNHPNIAAIYGLEKSDGTNFLVMELIGGQTLDEQIKSGPIPVEEALKLALQIAEALEAAHEKGVIHRDLKPANIKVTPDGKVKVLDFGLAKAFAGEQSDLNLSNSPTLSVAATQQGVILGTAAYMSPEQARGKEVDKRADIWAFGVALFEMLTSRQVFTGDTVSDTLASVLAREPEWQSLPANLHPRIRLLLERCLKKESKDRYSGISDARVDIQEVLADPGGVISQQITSMALGTKMRSVLPWAAIAAVLCSIIVGGSVWIIRTPGPPKPIHFEQYLKEGQHFVNSYSVLAVSPDGNRFTYATNEGLYLRSLNNSDATLIPGFNDYETCPFFSPDGKNIGYLSGVDSKLKKIPTGGGAAEIICATEAAMEAFWDKDNSIIFYDNGKGIKRVPAEGGSPEILIEDSGGGGMYHPRMLPDGKSVIFTSITDEGLQVFVQSTDSKERNRLLAGENAYYLPTGHLAYGLNNDIRIVPFDLKKLKVTGDETKVIDGVWRRAGGPQFAISESGTLVYVSSPPLSERVLVWVDRDGTEEEISAPPRAYDHPQISPNGDQIAFTIRSGGLIDVATWDIKRGIPTQLTDTGSDGVPFWSANGQKLFFSRFSNKVYMLYSTEADGSGEEIKVFDMPSKVPLVTDISKDGRILIYTIGGGPNSDIGEFLLGNEDSPKPLLDEKYSESNGKISPDGHWLAYESNKDGQKEVYVCSFPEVEDQNKKISVDGGYDPIWSPDGKEVFYRSEDSVMTVSIETKPKLTPGKPEKLFKDIYALMGDINTWDFDAISKRFLMVKDYSADSRKGSAELPKINIVLNWLEELKEKVPVD